MPLVILIIVILIVMAIAVYPWPLLLALATLVIAYLTYSSLYFRGWKFSAIKDRIQKYIQDCNELNQHIEELKSSPLWLIGQITAKSSIMTNASGG